MILINNSVTNFYGTEGFITNDFVANPLSYQEYPAGTYIYDISSNTFYYWNGLTLTAINTGGGGVGTIDQVLAQGNLANGKQQIMSGAGYVNTIQSDQILIQDQNLYNWDSKLTYYGYELTNPLYNSARCFLGYDFNFGSYVEIINDSSFEFINYVTTQRVTELASGKFNALSFQNFNNQTSILPEQGGTLESLQWAGRVDIDLNTGPFIIDPSQYTNSQVYFLVDGGPTSNPLALRSYGAREITLLVRTAPVQVTTLTNPLFTMTLYGNPNINQPGLYKAFFNYVNATTYEVYLSHT